MKNTKPPKAFCAVSNPLQYWLQFSSSNSRLVTPARFQIKSIPENCDKRHPSSNPSFAWEKLLKNNYLSNGRGLPATMTVGATYFRHPSFQLNWIYGWRIIVILDVIAGSVCKLSRHIKIIYVLIYRHILFVYRTIINYYIKQMV